MEKSKSYAHYNKFEMNNFEGKITRKSSTTNNKSSYNFNGERGNRGATLGASVSYDDAESKRKKRVASYNMYSVERKLKSSVKSSVRWFKSKFADVC